MNNFKRFPDRAGNQEITRYKDVPETDGVKVKSRKLPMESQVKIVARRRGKGK